MTSDSGSHLPGDGNRHFGWSPLRPLANMRLVIKLPIIIVGLALASSLALTTTAYFDARAIMEGQIKERFDSTLASRGEALRGLLTDIERDLEAQSESTATRSAMQAFALSWVALDGDRTRKLQKEYIEENPNPAGQKDAMTTSGSASQYDLVHTKYHSQFRSLLQARGYDDIILVDPDGNVVYTVFKELDFATSLADGPWRSSDLAAAWRKSRELASGDTAFFDFAPYAPSNNAPAGFISTPLTGRDGQRIGTLIYKLPIEGINAIMQGVHGLGESGQSFVLGHDGLLRSKPRGESRYDVLSPLEDDELVRQINRPDPPSLMLTDGLRNQPVESLFVPFKYKTADWTLVIEQDLDELEAPIINLRNMLALQTGGLALLIALAGMLIGRAISRPFGIIGQALVGMTQGELRQPTPFRGRGDDVGMLSRNLENLREKLAAAAEERQVQDRRTEEQQQVVRHLTSGIRKLAEGDLTARIEQAFAPDYEGLRTGFNGAVESLNDTVASLVSAAREIDNNAREVENASNDLSQKAIEQAANLEETAAAITQLSASVKSTADAASDADRVMTRARTDAEASGQEVNRAMTAMDRISTSSQKITQVTSVIEDLAFQTNLLALNAGVEAARAGEAGRGFAVVASEVRALAQRSSDAAKEINGLIQESAENVGSGVELVEKAGKSFEGMIDDFEKVSASVSAIAAAAREQSIGLEEINSAVDQLDGVTQKNAAVATQVHGTGKVMVAEAAKLNEVSSRFRIDTSVQAAAPRMPKAAAPARVEQMVANGAPMIARANDLSDDIWAEF
ncbi:methyl-accepting chemotaxis protein [Pseudooceanicola sp. 216_PA32_1]|uniref:Methyl-accepting chemotaxis protein n=1 Tax=Pseudooceanicola pacificus TaxID=2676438 RepID=A0A844VZW5_9RHOB|nr:methyl-accepting chemotaxis protein [Pseudooceanicola pacificus]MWB76987.1 methyl-accepting chemotaxis protein [Pseudooceanicola pacificus]